MSHPPTPPPRVSQEGLPDQLRGRSTLGHKPIGKAILAKDNNPVPETDSYLCSSMVPEFFKNPNPALPVPRVVAPEQLHVRDEFLATIYKVIEDKLQEEEGIYLASDAKVSEIKWQPLAPDMELPAADIISQEWAQTHTHSKFLREQACLNNIVATTWRFWWSANRLQHPDLYAEWNKIKDYCQVTMQTWYNIRFKELKEDSARVLGLDPISFKKITTSMEWLADEFEKAGTDPTYAAQQATARAESVLSSKQPSRINTLAPIPSPKARSRSADAIMKSHPSTPENKESIDIRMPTPKKIKERLDSMPSDITSLDYIDEPMVKEEPASPKDVEMSTVIVNPVPIRHKTKMILVADPVISKSKDKGKEKETMAMDTTADFASSKDTNMSYHAAPSTLSPGVQKFTKGVTPILEKEDKLR
ncbi:hypothetical protein AX15_006050 [Amanita polypyramis BW_CC]|nr:hypothetical protein AX15_006050 [Amanita polypyramis BW_CC]